MDGNKPKQRVEKPVDKQANLTLKTENDHDQAPIQMAPEDLGEDFKMPDYRPQSYFTRKQVSKEKKKRLRKIARKSKQINRRKNK